MEYHEIKKKHEIVSENMIVGNGRFASPVCVSPGMFQVGELGNKDVG